MSRECLKPYWPRRCIWSWRQRRSWSGPSDCLTAERLGHRRKIPAPGTRRRRLLRRGSGSRRSPLAGLRAPLWGTRTFRKTCEFHTFKCFERRNCTPRKPRRCSVFAQYSTRDSLNLLCRISRSLTKYLAGSVSAGLSSRDADQRGRGAPETRRSDRAGDRWSACVLVPWSQI